MNVLVKYPSRSRPALFVERIRQYLADPIVTILCTLDLDDERMNCPAICDFLAAQDRVKVRWGNCKSKVEACNDGLAEHDWSGLCLLASDDMVPQRADYASRILALHSEAFPHGDGVLHLNDGRVGGSLATICVCDRTYFDRTNYLYRPAPDGYTSVWCDNEWTEVAQKLGRYAYVDEVVIKHDWIGQHAPDALHRRNESFNDADVRVYRRRKAAGFP